MSPRRPTGNPRGRPKGKTPPLAPPIYVRLTPEERAEVEGLALAAGVSISAWVRGVVRETLIRLSAYDARRP